jgi:hypothetical protein
MSLSRKRKLVPTLQAAYGEDAASIVPLSYVLPNELRKWSAALEAAAAAGAEPGLWMLKTPQHLGKGLALLPPAEAVAEAGRHRPPPAKPYVCAQRYVADPLLIGGRKFGVRVWVLVTGHDPLRAYIHANGLALFSTHAYDGATWAAAGDAGGIALGHVTNYAQNMDGGVWDLSQLAEHLGAAPWAALWSDIKRNAALALAAALPDMHAAHAGLGVPPGTTFELLGLDYLVDSSLKPWLLEVNGTPSLAVDHADPAVEAVIHAAKFGMATDMFALLGCATRFAPRYELMRAAAAAKRKDGTQRSPGACAPRTWRALLHRFWPSVRPATRLWPTPTPAASTTLTYNPHACTTHTHSHHRGAARGADASVGRRHRGARAARDGQPRRVRAADAPVSHRRGLHPRLQHPLGRP